MTPDAPDTNSINPYEAPKSTVRDVAPVLGAQPAFFPVSSLKLVLMCLATLNFYQLYWFYENWKRVRTLNNEDVNAPIRAFFYPVTSYGLFRRIRDHANKVDGSVSLHAGPLAICILLFQGFWSLPDPYWLGGYLGLLPLLSVQEVVNKINRMIAPDADPNDRFRGWNIFALIVGGCLFVLGIIETLVGE